MGTTELRFIFDQICLRIHENALKIYLKIVYERIWDFLPEAQATLNLKVETI